MTTEFVHCDDLIEDPQQPDCLRRFLRWHRWPATYQVKAAAMGLKRPKLFADHDGGRIRVVMASRFGDVGITSNLAADYGYSVRVPVAELSNFSAEPPAQVSA